MTLMGASSKDEDPELLAHVPADVIQANVDAMELVDGAKPSLMQVGHVHKLFKHPSPNFQ